MLAAAHELGDPFSGHVEDGSAFIAADAVLALGPYEHQGIGMALHVHDAVKLRAFGPSGFEQSVALDPDAAVAFAGSAFECKGVGHGSSPVLGQGRPVRPLRRGDRWGIVRVSGVADVDLKPIASAVTEVLEAALAVKHHRQLQAFLVEVSHPSVIIPVLALDVGLDLDAVEDFLAIGFAPAAAQTLANLGLDFTIDTARQVCGLLVLKKDADGFGGGFDVAVDLVHGQCSPVLEAIVASMHGLYHAIP